MKQLEGNVCPVCGYNIDSASAIDGVDAIPQPGDVSICFDCTSYLIFDENIKSRVLTVDEIVDLPSDILYELTAERNKINKFKKYKQQQLADQELEETLWDLMSQNKS